MPDGRIDHRRATNAAPAMLTRDLRPVDETLRDIQALMLASSRDCVVILDLEAYTHFVSPGGIAAMEVADVDSIIGQSWLRVWSGADLDAAREAVAAARAGGIGRFEGFCPTHRGTPKWWDVVISPLPGPDGRPERLISIGRDITGRIQAQQRMMVSEQMLRQATDAAEIGTWNLDLVTNLLTRSERAEAMMGPALPVQYCLDNFCSGLHPDDRAMTVDAFKAAIDPAQRANYDVEFRFCHNGETRWIADTGRGHFDADGRCLRVTGTVIDITARKAYEERLRASEAELRELNATLEARVEERTRERDRAWNISRDLQAVCSADGILLAANAAYGTILDLHPDEVVGRNLRELIHPDDIPVAQQAVAAASSGHMPLHEVRHRHKDGTYRWISWVGAFADGLLYANGRHVTAEKAAAAELEATQEKLRQSQKMEAVGQLTGGLAHDFNNLLAGISGSLEMLQMHVAAGRLDTVDRFINLAQSGARRAAALTQRLLAFSRRQTLDPRATDVNRLIAGMEDLIRRTVGPDVTVEVGLAAEPWPALVDPNQLENALLNLCINARDAMPDGGRLVIETQNRWLDARCCDDHDLADGQYVSLAVRDNGSGMSQAVAARAFDPFFTTKPLGQGTGLGLSMIYGFARQSGGLARICSELGHGTLVSVFLPRHRGDCDEDQRQAATEVSVPAGSGETVLVVDDEAGLRMLIVELLEESGYRTIEAADGPAGLAVLRSGTRIDLLVTDVGLPGGMNGRQVADAGRVLHPGLKVLFITGYAETAVIGNGQLESGMLVLTKPFGLETFVTKVKQLVEG